MTNKFGMITPYILGGSYISGKFVHPYFTLQLAIKYWK